MSEIEEPERAGKTFVIKIGSNSLSNENGKRFDLKLIVALVDVVCKLRARGHFVVLVSSGAVSVGCMRLRITERPEKLITKQAISAVGQCRLMRLYDDLFSVYDQAIAQVLLSRENLNSMQHYQNALNTFEELKRLGIVPIVNENDTVSVGELRVGDNDSLSAMVASLISADDLILLTDVDALYTADPTSNPQAKAIRRVESIEDIKAEIGSGGKWGTGGMATKLQAARIATAAGVRTTICNALHPERALEIEETGELTTTGTTFAAKRDPIKGKKKWLAHGLRVTGEIWIDDAARTLVLQNASCMVTGLIKVSGDFYTDSNVLIRDKEGKELGRGLAAYSCVDLEKLIGKKPEEYEAAVGFNGPEYAVHRLNIVLGTFVEL